VRGRWAGTRPEQRLSARGRKSLPLCWSRCWPADLVALFGHGTDLPETLNNYVKLHRHSVRTQPVKTAACGDSRPELHIVANST
jgi:hypothetical protein